MNYEQKLNEIAVLAGGINEFAVRELRMLLKIAELNGIEKGIKITKETLLTENQ
jgi:hypothetical protein